jgi:hypothetical protein
MSVDRTKSATVTAVHQDGTRSIRFDDGAIVRATLHRRLVEAPPPVGARVAVRIWSDGRMAQIRFTGAVVSASARPTE